MTKKFSSETNLPWWKKGVIYQIYPRSFNDTSGNGIGDLKGISKKISYLSSLGVDALWLSPIFTSPMKDMGYDVSNYTDIDPLFGDIHDFERLIGKAKENKIKVIIDQVLSHSSDAHPFFKLSKSNKNNSKSDWYVWADPKPDGSPPNNWLSVFGGSAWEWDTGREQYYLHNFLKSQPDFNFHNIDVQKWLLSTVKFWLEKGVDGFRLDTANYYFHDKKLRNNPAIKSKASGKNPYYYQNLKYSINQKDNFAFLKKLRKLTDQYKETTMIGEISNVELQAKYTANNDKLHMAYSFDLLRDEFSPKHIRNTVSKFFKETKDGWPTWSFSNHDVVRHLSRWNKTKKDRQKFAKLTCALLMSLKGTPCIYQGEELGQTQTKIEFDEIKDPPGKKFWPMDFGRDGCRTPMIWDESKKFAGFSNAKPWLPIKEEQIINSVKKQLKNRNSTYHFYKTFISLRKKISFFTEEIYFEKNNEVLIFYRGNEKQICCMFNLSQREISIDNTYGKIIPFLPSQQVRQDSKKLNLSSYGFCFLSKKDFKITNNKS